MLRNAWIGCLFGHRRTEFAFDVNASLETVFPQVPWSVNTGGSER